MSKEEYKNELDNMDVEWTDLISKLLIFLDILALYSFMDVSINDISKVDFSTTMTIMRQTYNQYYENKNIRVFAVFDHFIRDINNIQHTTTEIKPEMKHHYKIYYEYMAKENINIPELFLKLRQCILHGIINNKKVEEIQQDYNTLYEPFDKANRKFNKNHAILEDDMDGDPYISEEANIDV